MQAPSLRSPSGSSSPKGPELCLTTRLPTVIVGTVGASAGTRDGRQRAASHSQKEAIETKSLGKSLVLLPFMSKFTGQCSPLKSSGSFSFPSFDGDFLKQAVADKRSHSLAHTAVPLNPPSFCNLV